MSSPVETLTPIFIGSEVSTICVGRNGLTIVFDDEHLSIYVNPKSALHVEKPDGPDGNTDIGVLMLSKLCGLHLTGLREIDSGLLVADFEGISLVLGSPSEESVIFYWAKGSKAV